MFFDNAHKLLKGKCFRKDCTAKATLALVTSIASTQTWTGSANTVVCAKHAGPALKAHIETLTQLAQRIKNADDKENTP